MSTLAHSQGEGMALFAGRVPFRKAYLRAARLVASVQQLVCSAGIAEAVPGRGVAQGSALGMTSSVCALRTNSVGTALAQAACALPGT